ncbi:MAG: dethiobiotin synthase [Chitinispirillales bacterium]|jgi:dethiobiotin synthetase|nr:dethiobiotin synthase [Chitinispirillales bacterium]
MTKGFFIAGSGTGVGKTYVATTLLSGCAELQRSATYMKPIETGCERAEDGTMLTGSDTLDALSFVCSKHKTDIDLHSPYRFHPACSPHLAARMDGSEICIKKIVSVYEKLKKATSTEAIFVEGAGGILVPIGDRKYVADLMKALEIPAILVVDAGLGTLNHTFMSLRILEHYDIPLAGVVINNAQNAKRDFIYEDNVKTIREHISPSPILDIDCDEMSNEPLKEFCNEILYGV